MDKQEGKHAGGIDYEFTDITKLKPAEYNPRTITDDEFSGLKESIKTFGFVDPAIINKDFTIIGGHQRIKAAEALGMTNVPCVILDLDKKQEKKLNVILNSHAISGKYDDLKLSEILEELKLDEDYESLRLNVLEPLDLSPTEVEEDEAPEVSQDPPVSKLGEIYQLGRHRVMCGDSTDYAATLDLLGEKHINLVFTDPPYGIDVVKDGKVGADFGVAKKGQYSEVINDNTTDTAKHFYDVVAEIADRIILFGGNYFTSFLPFSDGWLVWDKRGDSGIKNTFADGEMAWCSFHTPIRIYTQLWNGMIREGEKDKRVHPTQKPIKTLGAMIQDFSEPSDVIYDGFLGSGSTLIAYEQTDRTCYGMELDPKYVDVIRKRYWKFVNDGNEEGWQDGTTN